MYAVPFYGESSFLMYREDLLEQAGITLSEKPTWTEVEEAAEQLDTDRVAGICLRGQPGWGQVLAPLDTVINTFGGRWFDEDWNAQLTSPEVERASEALRFEAPGATAFARNSVRSSVDGIESLLESNPPGLVRTRMTVLAVR